LLANGLWSHVDSPATEPSEEIAQTLIEFQLDAHKSLSGIVLAIKPSQLYLVMSCETPISSWAALAEHFKQIV